MSDLRATERLLEVIDEGLAFVVECLTLDDELIDGSLAQARGAITELRRRGDTLVRRGDLRRVLEAFDHIYVDTDRDAAVERLENAIGGKP